MKKMKLNLDELQIESFATTVDALMGIPGGGGTGPEPLGSDTMCVTCSYTCVHATCHDNDVCRPDI